VFAFYCSLFENVVVTVDIAMAVAMTASLWCRLLQSVAVHLQCICSLFAVCLQSVAVCTNVLQSLAMLRSLLVEVVVAVGMGMAFAMTVSMCCSLLQSVAVWLQSFHSLLQSVCGRVCGYGNGCRYDCVVVCCSLLQSVAVVAEW